MSDTGWNMVNEEVVSSKDVDGCFTVVYPPNSTDTVMLREYNTPTGLRNKIFIPFDILAAYVDYHRNKINDART